MKNPFRSKYRELAGQLQTNNEALEAQLSVEIAKRVAAESLAAERGKEVDRFYQMLKDANDSRDAAVTERLKSLDLVNQHLLRPLEPEKTVDMTQYHVVSRPRNVRRIGEAAFIQNQLKAQGVIKPRVEGEPHAADSEVN